MYFADHSGQPLPLSTNSCQPCYLLGKQLSGLSAKEVRHPPPPAWGWLSPAPLPPKAQGPVSCPAPTQDAYLNGSGRVTCDLPSGFP